MPQVDVQEGAGQLSAATTAAVQSLTARGDVSGLTILRPGAKRAAPGGRVTDRAVAARTNPLTSMTAAGAMSDTRMTRQNARHHMVTKTADEAQNRLTQGTVSGLATLDQSVKTMLSLGLPSAYVQVTFRGMVDGQVFVSLVRDSANGSADGRRAFLNNRYLSLTSYATENCFLTGGDRDFTLSVESFGPDDNLWLSPIVAATRLGCDVRLDVTILSVSAGRADGRMQVTCGKRDGDKRQGPNGLVTVADVGANGLESTVSNAMNPWCYDMMTMFRDLANTCLQSLSYFHKQLLAMSAALVFNRDGNEVTPLVDRLLVKAAAHYCGANMSNMTIEQKRTYLTNIVQAVNVTADDWSDLLRVTDADVLPVWENYDVFTLLAVTASPLMSWSFGTKALEDEVTGEYLHSAFMPCLTTDMTHIEHDSGMPSTKEGVAARLVHEILDKCVQVGASAGANRISVMSILKTMAPACDPVVQSLVRALSTDRAIVIDNNANHCLIRELSQAHAFVSKHEFDGKGALECRQYQLPRHVLTVADPNSCNFADGKQGAEHGMAALHALDEQCQGMAAQLKNAKKTVTYMTGAITGVMTTAHNVWAALVPGDDGKHHLTDDLVEQLTVPHNVVSANALTSPHLPRKEQGECDMWKMAVASILAEWAATPGSDTVVDFVKFG